MKYVEFQNYRFRRGEIVGSNTIRVYTDIPSIVTLYPFVTVIIMSEIGEDGEPMDVEYYELRNVNNQVIYVTDGDGLKTLYPSDGKQL